MSGSLRNTTILACAGLLPSMDRRSVGVRSIFLQCRSPAEQLFDPRQPCTPLFGTIWLILSKGRNVLSQQRRGKATGYQSCKFPGKVGHHVHKPCKLYMGGEPWCIPLVYTAAKTCIGVADYKTVYIRNTDPGSTVCWHGTYTYLYKIALATAAAVRRPCG
jgi:hypothetical protein